MHLRRLSSWLFHDSWFLSPDKHILLKQDHYYPGLRRSDQWVTRCCYQKEEMVAQVFFSSSSSDLLVCGYPVTLLLQIWLTSFPLRHCHACAFLHSWQTRVQMSERDSSRVHYEQCHLKYVLSRHGVFLSQNLPYIWSPFIFVYFESLWMLKHWH